MAHHYGTDQSEGSDHESGEGSMSASTRISDQTLSSQYARLYPSDSAASPANQAEEARNEGNRRNYTKTGLWAVNLAAISEEPRWNDDIQINATALGTSRRSAHGLDNDRSLHIPSPCSSSNSSKVSSEICSRSREEEEEDVDDSDDDDEEEVQSYRDRARGGLNTLASLEDALPVKKGLSGFFSGKSRSFACLADVSIEDMAKPEDRYAKRRKLYCRSRFHTKKSSKKARAVGARYEGSLMQAAIALSNNRSNAQQDEPLARSHSCSDLHRAMICSFKLK